MNAIATTELLQHVKSAFERYGQKVKHYHSKNYCHTNNPTRKDKHPSLIFGVTPEGRLWFKDFSSAADPAAILRKIGLDPETLRAEAREFKPGPRPAKRAKKPRFNFNQPDAIYNYLDPAGSPVYQVRRFNFTTAAGAKDKTFVQFHWQDGRWQAGRGATPELLYNLPAVVKASRVIGVEGEKAADALARLGYVATTHAGGAGSIDKALGAYRTWLHDKEFIYLPDNDKPGQEMAAALASGLIAIVARGATVDPALFGGEKADIADVIDRLKKELLSDEAIRAEVDRILDQAQPWQPTQPTGPGPKELERLAARERFMAEAAQQRQAKAARKQAALAEKEGRWQAGNCVNFLGDEEIDPDEIEYKRAQFTNSRKWQTYVEKHYPDLDSELQRRIKLAENKEARPGKCGEYRKEILPNGQAITQRWTCGICERCLKRSVLIYRRALNEIQGIPSETRGATLPGAKQPRAIKPWDFGPEDEGRVPVLDGRWPWVETSGGRMKFEDDLGDFIRPQQPGQVDDAPRENAPPLPKVQGELSIIRIEGEFERRRFSRQLKRAGVKHRSLPVALEDGRPAYDFIVNDDRGDPLGLITDKRIELWVKGAEGKRARGDLLPSLKNLETRYREALPFEVVSPELVQIGEEIYTDAKGKKRKRRIMAPADPDIFALELSSIGTTRRLPEVVSEIEANDAKSLQAALDEIHDKQLKILGRRGHVHYGVCVKRKFYTRYSTLPRLLAEFKASQEAIKQRRRKK